mmetsp:Transcript_17680/g.36207  ORF Transcript_17680/g.36207 Transcript_17680/m.36207 type:complete len:87 (+) Transcript_17680:111-371(+)
MSLSEEVLTLRDVEERVRDLSDLSGVSLNEEVFQVVLELVQLDVVPTAIAQVLKSLCNKANTANARTATATGRTTTNAGLATLASS